MVTGAASAQARVIALSRSAPAATSRYRVVAWLVRGGRRRRIKIQASWPWAEADLTKWRQRFAQVLKMPSGLTKFKLSTTSPYVAKHTTSSKACTVRRSSLP